MKLDKDWAVEFVAATDALRREGYTWEKLGELVGSAEKVRSLYRRAKTVAKT